MLSNHTKNHNQLIIKLINAIILTGQIKRKDLILWACNSSPVIYILLAHSMLDIVIATRFNKRMNSGRTKPSLLTCIDNNNNDIEVIAKFSGGCDRGVDSLITESISAILASDLGLPVPRPYLIEIDQAFIDIIPDSEIKLQMGASSLIGFGSLKLPSGYYNWSTSQDTPADINQAAEIIAFDGLIQNPDRRPENTNCLTNGKDLAIFDHDLAFVTEGVLFWKPPWEHGGLDNLIWTQKHIFYDQLKRKSIDLERFRDAWASINDTRLQEYENSIPPEWLNNSHTATRIISYIRDVRDNIDDSLSEVSRLLS